MNPLLDNVDGLRALVRGLLADEASVDDVVQETRIAALRSGPRPGVPRVAWLRRVARNFALKRMRGERRRRAHEERAPAGAPRPGPAEAVERLDLQQRVLAELRALAEPYRSTLVRRFLEEVPAAEIARTDGVPAATVRTRIRRGLEMLRRRLDGACGGRRAWQAALLPLLGRSRTAAAVGGIAMGAKLKVVAVALLALAVGLLVWRVRAVPERDRADREAAVPAAGPDRPGVPGLSADGGELASAREPVPALPWDLHLLVVDGTGAPVSGAEASFQADGRLLDRLHTDDAGHVVLLVKGTGRLLVRHRDRAPRRMDRVKPTRDELRVVMPTGRKIAGRVFAADESTPVARFNVAATPVDVPGAPRGFERSGFGRKGRFEIDGLLPGRYRLRVTSRLPGPDPAAEPFVEAGDEDVRVVMPRMVPIRIEIRDATTDGPVYAPMEARLVGPDEDRLLMLYATTDPSRKTEHRVWLPPEIGGAVTVLADGYAPGAPQALGPVDPGGEITLQFSLMPDPGYLGHAEFIVRDDRGRPLDAIHVMRGMTYPPNNWFGDNYELPPAGRIAFDLRPGPHAFRIGPRDPKVPFVQMLLETRVDVDIPRGQTVVREVNLERGGWVQLRTKRRFVEFPRVVDESGDTTKLHYGREHGWFAGPLAPGRYVARATLPRGEPLRRDLVITPGRTTLLEE